MGPKAGIDVLEKGKETPFASTGSRNPNRPAHSYATTPRIAFNNLALTLRAAVHLAN